MGRSPFSPRPRVSTHVKRWEMPCHLLDDAIPRPRPYTPWVLGECVPCRSMPFWVIWDNANRPQISSFHSSTSMIADFQADHESLVREPCRKKVHSRAPDLC